MRRQTQERAGPARRLTPGPCRRLARPALWAARIGTIVAAAAAVAALWAGPAAALSTGGPGWQWQHPLPHSTSYNSAYFTSVTKGFLVTDNCILSTNDGGASVTVRANHNVRLQDITFVGKYGWAVGWGATDGGRVIIYRSTNKGISWSRVPTDVRGYLNSVDFVSRYVGWAVGMKKSRPLILKTMDGGLNWTEKTLVGWDGANDVSMVSATRGWLITGGARVFRTTNGGATWKQIGRGLDETPLGVRFITNSSGWVACWGKVLKTTNGGLTWTTQLDLGLGPVELANLGFSDLEHGWVVAQDGTVWATIDGGAHWTVNAATAGPSLTHVAPVDATSAVVVGGGGRVGRSSDNGASWSWSPQAASGFAGSLEDIDFVDANTGWAAGGNAASGGLPATTGILHTTDAGATWTWQNPGTLSPLAALDFVDAANGWAVGLNGAIVHTANGGTTWTPQASATTADLEAVTFLDALHGWAVGGDYSGSDYTGGGIVRKTIDGGAHWTPVVSALFAAKSFYGVAFADALHGWIVGWDAGEGDGEPCVILGTSDGGTTWTKQFGWIPPVGHSVGGASFQGVVALDAGRVVAVGAYDNADVGRPMVFRTANGGTTWTRATVPTKWGSGAVGLADVSFADGSNGWAVGWPGTILRTSDGGAHWAQQRSGFSGGLNGVWFTSATRGWVCGSWGAILRTTSGGAAP